MNATTSPRPALRRLCLPLARPEIRACVGAVLVIVAIIAAGAAFDPSGLLAPVGGRGLPPAGAGGVYRWAALVIGLPVLLIGATLPLFVIARAGRPAVSARWVFVAGWIAVTGAGALATAAAGLASVTPLLGAHLSAGSALRFAIATSGFAAIKYALAGPVVAAAAALAYRFGPKPVGVAAGTGDGDPVEASGDATEAATGARAAGPAGAAVVATAVMFVIAALGAAAFGARWWRGGPVGYAFTGPLLAPTVSAGAAGFLAGMAVFLAAFAAIVRAAQRRLARQVTAPAVAATVWLAAVVAGLVLGVVDATVAALPSSASLPAPAGPDSWWIATSLLSVGAGIGYGVAVGVIGALLSGLLWRGPATRLATRAPGRTKWIMTAALGAAVLAVPLVIGAPDPAGPPPVAPVAATGGLERLRVLPASTDGGLPVIGDVTGRQVILRGVNVNQLIDYYLRDPAIPAVTKPTDADFAQMAAMGFNVVRLGMSWSRLEPSRGVFDHVYLRQIRAAVASAKAHGIYTVLDMHEDAWGTSLARPTEECGGGTSPTTGWDGAPAWATITDGTAHCQFLARDLAPAVATSFGNFYTDRDGIQTELVRAWAYVAGAFADEPAVAGFDLLNEPGIGPNPPISSGLLLGRYYDAAITAIRAAESAGHGYPHLIFFEPSVLWSGLAFDVAPPPGFTADRQLVFAPHPYSESISMDQSFGLTLASIERNLTVSSRAAAAYGAALWTGEWGWFGDPATDGAKVQRFVEMQDRLGIGGAFWVWRQGCGSPETGPDAVTSGNLVRVDCASGALIAPPDGFARPLTRAYPRAFPGRLDSLASGPDGRNLRLAATVDSGANCQLDIWVPGDRLPEVVSVGVSDQWARQVPGGWRFTGCAAGAYTVTIIG